MKVFNGKIAMQTNSRGCDIVDTVKGCSVCSTEKPLGCYDNCYAKMIADRYGLDFTNPIKRSFDTDIDQIMLFDFVSSSHINEVVRKIRSSKMPFVRIGEMGDPSEDWEHTLNMCGVISMSGKPIVIITKHWKVMSDSQVEMLRELNITVNTSISALDSEQEIDHRLNQYHRLSKYCNSVLRVVTCNFNTSDEKGYELDSVQDWLLDNPRVIETVFRPSLTNKLVTNKVINVERIRFLGSTANASIRKPSTFMGYCTNCPDMCGVTFP